MSKFLGNRIWVITTKENGYVKLHGEATIQDGCLILKSVDGKICVLAPNAWMSIFEEDY